MNGMENKTVSEFDEEITGTLARQYWPIVMDGKKNKTMKEFDYGYGSAKAEIEEFGMDDDSIISTVIHRKSNSGQRSMELQHSNHMVQFCRNHHEQILLHKFQLG